ncbi:MULTISPECIES: rod shape-determining protein MreC [unclassified Capnocytophaga]|jgi:Cell shape-determining protein|uniref:rod shape-determining protein MreC n=1 Tax=unclassified Capnocytophaga TaxID=2640652 RepID=UPI000202C624|nr:MULTISPECIES: rod shape-determining protein MreC [unclassified Capnocytophaga]EGD33507.1 rod shape-determining protein MreC [Capnocytophaga sp. oral taxon 338 str. F0234]MEB3004208.1 rod shape-determining protein MreC [Capnocytophaga sp. G2]
MRLILLFFKRQKDFLVFLVLFLLSFALVIDANSFQKSKFLYIANGVTGNIFLIQNGIEKYFYLKQQNESLSQENRRLQEELLKIKAERLEELSQKPILLFSPNTYSVFRAEVIKNSYHLAKNYLIINKGEKDSIREDMGVVSPQGIVGIIDKTSRNFSSVQSVLNSLSKISATHLKSGYYGTLSWDGKDPTVVQLSDIPSLATISVGDTIVTAGHSNIFPKGIPIGKVKDVNANTRDNSLLSNVILFSNMRQLQHVYVIKNREQEQIKELEEEIQQTQNE